MGCPYSTWVLAKTAPPLGTWLSQEEDTWPGTYKVFG